MSHNIFLKRFLIIFKLKWIKILIKGKLLSFSSFEIVSNLKQIAPQLKTILDVGANQGQFQKASNYFYPTASISSFEPIPELYLKLESFKKSRFIKNYNLALGNQEGNLKFNENEYNHSSSFLDINEENNNFPSNKTKKISVNTTTLDSFSESLEINSPSLLKLDVQGFELEVLKGATNTIKTKIDYIIVETNFEELYKNQPSFTELNTFLNQNGFQLKAMLDCNMGNKLNYIEADFLYKKVL